MPMPALTQAILRETVAAHAARGRYVLGNVRLDPSTMEGCLTPAAGADFVLADLTVEAGKIARIAAARPASGRSGQDDAPVVDIGGQVALPLFVDCHTHLDKGHILPRTGDVDGAFATALSAAKADREANWSSDDLLRRMDFSLRCAHHYGTRALRTHLDSQPPQDAVSWPVFRELREQWRGRIDLQGSCLFGIDFARDEAFLARISQVVAASGGVLGAVAYPVPDLDRLLDRMFAAAGRYGLDLDFHADETADPSSDCLRRIALAALRAKPRGNVLVGHCCSLAGQPASAVDDTLGLVAESGIAVVSLPTCNLYLQDRRHDGTTPRWRGVTLLHEMRRRGIPVVLGSDNTRDPFHAYGDLDMLETYRLGTRVLHLDNPTGTWPTTVSTIPAAIMGLDRTGAIREGQRADFILFEGRSWSEILSRPESNRVVIRDGCPQPSSLPSYAELDGLAGLAPD
ncbi:cytosine deaminase (plasmid) [Microvirga sp. M2]